MKLKQNKQKKKKTIQEKMEKFT